MERGLVAQRAGVKGRGQVVVYYVYIGWESSCWHSDEKDELQGEKRLERDMLEKSQ